MINIEELRKARRGLVEQNEEVGQSTRVDDKLMLGLMNMNILSFKKFPKTNFATHIDLLAIYHPAFIGQSISNVLP